MASTARAGKDLDRPLARHRKWMKRFLRFAKRRGDRCLTMHYEALCASPQAELERLAAFLGIDFEPAMLRPAEKPHHFVHSSVSGYLKASNEIRRDERWQEELPFDAIERIERVMKKLSCFDGRMEVHRAPAGDGVRRA
jgi:Sulfotransferase domain